MNRPFLDLIAVVREGLMLGESLSCSVPKSYTASRMAYTYSLHNVHIYCTHVCIQIYSHTYVDRVYIHKHICTYVCMQAPLLPLTSSSVSAHLWKLMDHLQRLRVSKLAHKHPVCRQVGDKPAAAETGREERQDTPHKYVSTAEPCTWSLQLMSQISCGEW